MSDILFIFMCSQLKDDCLSATTTSCPLIESLILMSCQSIGPDGLYSLRSLQNLTMLDLSYTFLTNLEPVFESCLQLKVVLVSIMHNCTTYTRCAISYYITNVYCAIHFLENGT